MKLAWPVSQIRSLSKCGRSEGESGCESGDSVAEAGEVSCGGSGATDTCCAKTWGIDRRIRSANQAERPKRLLQKNESRDLDPCALRSRGYSLGFAKGCKQGKSLRNVFGAFFFQTEEHAKKGAPEIQSSFFLSERSCFCLTVDRWPPGQDCFCLGLAARTAKR